MKVFDFNSAEDAAAARNGGPAMTYTVIRSDAGEASPENPILVIRKGTGSADVSGDYNDYPETRDVESGGLAIRCFGADGQIRLARWESGGNSYSLAFNAGDTARPGLTEDQVTSLVSQIR